MSFVHFSLKLHEASRTELRQQQKIEIKNGLVEILLLAVQEEEIDPWFSGEFVLYYFTFFHAIYCENPNIDIGVNYYFGFW